MTCPSPAQLLAAADGREDRGALSHAASCPRCRKAIAALEDSRLLLESLPVPALRPALWEGVARELEADAAAAREMAWDRRTAWLKRFFMNPVEVYALGLLAALDWTRPRNPLAEVHLALSMPLAPSRERLRAAWTPGVRVLLALLAALFGIQLLLSGLGIHAPWLSTSSGQLLASAWILWMMGIPLEARWGARRFLAFAGACTLGSSLAVLAISRGGAASVLDGAGAAFGILVAYAMNASGQRVRLLFWPAPAWLLAVLLAALELGLLCLGGSLPAAGHLAGGLVGLAWIRRERSRSRRQGQGKEGSLGYLEMEDRP
jgi:hypothetical protein